MAWNDGMDLALGGYNNAIANNMQQGAHLAGMANQVMGAIGAENDSRVAQVREMRRMEHEKELMRLRLEAQRKEREGDMIRQILASM